MKKRGMFFLLTLLLCLLALWGAQAETNRQMMLVSTYTNNAAPSDTSGYSGVYATAAGNISLAPLDKTTWQATLQAASNYTYTGLTNVDSLVGLPVTVTLDDSGNVTHVALLGKKLTVRASQLTSTSTSIDSSKGWCRVKGVISANNQTITMEWAKLNFRRENASSYPSPRVYVKNPNLAYGTNWSGGGMMLNQQVDEIITLVDTDGKNGYDWMYSEYVLNGLRVEKIENGLLYANLSAGSYNYTGWVTGGLAYEYQGEGSLEAGMYVNIRLKGDPTGTQKTVNGQKLRVRAVVTPADTVTGLLTEVTGSGTDLSCKLENTTYKWTSRIASGADGKNGVDAGRTSLEGWKGQEVTLVLDESGLAVRAFLAPEKEYMLVSTWTNNAAPVANTGFEGMYSRSDKHISLAEIRDTSWRDTLAGAQNYVYTGSDDLDGLVGLPVRITRNTSGEVTRVEAIGTSYTCRASQITSTNAKGYDTSKGYARRMGTVTVGDSELSINWKKLNFQYADKSFASSRVFSRNPTTSYGTNWSGSLMLVGALCDEYVTLVDTDGDKMFDWIYTQCVLNGAKASQAGESLSIDSAESSFGSYTERNSWLRKGLKASGTWAAEDYVNVRILPDVNGTKTAWRGKSISVKAQSTKATTVTGRMNAVSASTDFVDIIVTLDNGTTYTWTNIMEQTNADGKNGETAGRTLMAQKNVGKKFTLVLDESGYVVRAVMEKEPEYMLVSTWNNNIGNNGADYAGMASTGADRVSLAVIGDSLQATLRTATNCRYTGPDIDHLVGLPVDVVFDGSGNVLSITARGTRVDCMAGQLTGSGDNCYLDGSPIQMDWERLAFTGNHESARAVTRNANMTYSSNWSGEKRFFNTKCDEHVTLVDTDGDGAYDWIYSYYVMNGSEVISASGGILKTAENPMGSASYGGWGLTRIRYESSDSLSVGDFVDIVFTSTAPEKGLYKANRNGAALYGLATVQKARTVTGILQSVEKHSTADITCVVDGQTYTWTDQWSAGGDGTNGANAGRSTLDEHVGESVTLVLDRMGYVVRAVFEPAQADIPSGAVAMMLVSTSTNNIGINDRSREYDGVYSKTRGSISLASLGQSTWRDTLKTAKNYRYKGTRNIDNWVGLPVAVVFDEKDNVTEVVPIGSRLQVQAGSLTTSGGKYYANGKQIEMDWRMLAFDQNYESARCYTKNSNFTYTSNWSKSSLMFDTYTDELVTLVDTNNDGKYDWIYSDPVWNGVRVRGLRRHQIKGWSFPVGSWSYNGWTARWIYCDLLDDTIQPNDYVNIRFVATEPNKAIYVTNRNRADLYIKAIVSRADTVTGTLESITRKSATNITCKIDGMEYQFSGRICQNGHSDGVDGANSGRLLWTEQTIGQQVSAVMDSAGYIVRCFVGDLPADASVPGTGDTQGAQTRWLLAAGGALMLVAAAALLICRRKARKGQYEKA